MNEDILQNINHRIDNALEYSRQLMEDDEFLETIEATKNQIEIRIRTYPLQSIAIGLFAGYVFGKIFSSKNS